MDAFYETLLENEIQTTGRGIGPSYAYKARRINLRIGDILNYDEFIKQYEFMKKMLIREIEAAGYNVEDFKIEGKTLEEYEKLWLEGVQYIKKNFKLIECSYYVNAALDAGMRVLAEGAQGTMLDVDYGSYPFITSSSTIAAGICSGIGVSPKRVGKVYGIFKAYCTRVGAGPFPTELFDETGEKLRQDGHEFGASTGRPRRCGWLDLPALKYAITISGITDLVMMKSDILSDFENIKVATAYHHNGENIKYLPYEACTETMEPVYTVLKGWKQKIDSTIPQKLEEYIQFIEDYTQVHIGFVSYGPKREQNIWRR